MSTSRGVGYNYRSRLRYTTGSRILWQRNGLMVDGEYEPPNERQGRVTALEKLVTDIVDGAQSQW
jgi:hypothetical protein